ncbi:MAG: tRNA lysidine(34) synthetase TilS, partial [Marinirhabdus sp.]
MLKKVEAHINQNLPFLHGKKILIACSGGLDSVVLAHIFTKLRFTIALAHCNFSLRGSESTADQTFVHKLAEKWNIPCYSGTFNTKTFSKTHKISTQMAARELRYSWFAQTATNLDYDYVLTAHHADDAMETFFINLSRGTGLRGLKGIPQTNGKVVRPLLPFTRADLLAFAKSENIFWREDSSNTSTQYTRNKLRLQVLPAYKQLTKNTVPNFQRSLHHLQQDHTLLE